MIKRFSPSLVPNVCRKYCKFLLDPLHRLSLQVEILSVRLSDSVCPSSLLILFLIQTLSSRNLPQSTLVTQPLPRYPMSSTHVSHACQSTGPPSQSTGPPMNRIISQTFLFHLGRVMCQLDIFGVVCDEFENH